MIVSNLTKVIFAGVIGAGLGSAVTYLYLNKHYAEKADREIESVKKLYSRKSASKSEETEEEPEEKEVIMDSPDDYGSDIYQNFKFGEHYKDYTTYSTKSSDTQDTLHPTDDEGESKIFTISSVNYDEDHLYSKKIIYYFTEDDIFLDEENEWECIADDGKSLGDYKTLVAEGFDLDKFINSQTDDAVYVRNENVQIDFLIMRMQGSYD